MNVVVFDVDGTLTPIGSSWHYLHIVLGSRHRSNSFKRAFLEGSIAYEEWVYLDLALWKGVSYETFRKVLLSIPWRSGIEMLKELVKKYRKTTRFIAITCGFEELAQRCVRELGFDYGVGVRVEVDERGKLTGRPLKFVEAWSKREELEEYLSALDRVDKIVAVGDSIIDVPLFEVSDVSIVFCPSNVSELERRCDILIRSCNLRTLVRTLDQILAK